MTVIFQLLFSFVHSVYSIGENMFVVQLDVNGTNSNCAGSIITENAVLTSAQCVYGRSMEDLIVVQSTANGVHKHSVESVYIHPHFYSITLYSDVSIVKIHKKFHDPWIAVVINNVGLRTNLKNYQNCNMVGWFSRDEMKLLNEEKFAYRLDTSGNDFIFDEYTTGLTRVPVGLITGEQCSRKISDFGGHFDGHQKLCGLSDGRTEFCSIGPGGPLLCLGKGRVNLKKISYSPEIGNEYDNHVSDRLDDPFDLLADFEMKIPNKKRRETDDDHDEFQIGLVSWGKICSKVPSLFIRIDAYYDWISNTVKLFDNSTKPIRTYTDVFLTASRSTKSFLQISSFLPIILFTFSYPAIFTSN